VPPSRGSSAALTVLAEGDVAVTAHGVAMVEEPMAISDRVAAVRFDVERIQDHGQPRFEIEAGVRWRWTDEESERRDGEIREALAHLADGPARPSVTAAVPRSAPADIVCPR
jgi:hypothetical protein